MSRRRANHEGTKPRKRKDGRWVVQVSLDGKRRDLYGKTAQQARNAAKKLIADHHRGLDLEGANLTLAEFLNRWLTTTVRRKREGTYRSYENAIRVHILPNPPSGPLGHMPLGKISRAHIEAWLTNRLTAGLAPYTVWRLHAILRAGLNRAVKADPPILTRNPASLIDPVQYELEEVDPLSAAEARRVLEATRDATAHALYAVALGLGLREGELLGLRWAHGVNDPGIDLDRGEVRVYEQLQFGRLVPLKRSWARRVLPMSPWLVAVLERHGTLLEDTRQLAGQKWREHGLVFPTSVGTPQRASNAWLSWKRLQKRLALGDHKFHDLRHTFATLALHAGVPLWKVSKMLGHRDITITLRVYGHLTPEGREDVAERMEEVLGPRLEPIAVKLRSSRWAETPRGVNFEFEIAPLSVPGEM